MISFNCPFCAHSFNVEDVLAGKEINCPQCQGKVPVPGAPAPAAAAQPPPQPAVIDTSTVAQNMKTKQANTQSTIALVLGAVSLMCGCFTMPFAIVFGIMAISKAGVDPNQMGTIKVKSIAGIGMSLVFTLIWASIFLLGVRQTEKKRLLIDSEMVVAQQAFEGKEFDKATHLYELYAEDGYNREIKSTCNLRLGQIAFEQGKKSKARSYFGKAVKIYSLAILESNNQEEQELFRKIRVETLVNKGESFFPVPKIKGGLSEKVRFSSWRIQGNRITCDVRFPGNWSEMHISWAVYGEDNVLIGEYDFDSAPSDDDDNIGYLYLPWNTDWDLIHKIIVHVNKK